jgi:Xaa-Pro aminopeptidase
MVTRSRPPEVTADLPRVSREEFLGRQDRLRQLGADRGLSGILAWSRGATTQDQYADVFYLSNFYSHYPAVPDAEGRWRAKGCMGLVVPVDGPVTLVTDLATFRDDLAVADAVGSDQDVIGAAARALATDADPARGPIGVLGSAALSWRWMEGLRRSTPHQFVAADHLGPELRLIKSEAEQELLRAAGRVGARGVEAVMEAAVPGATEAELAAAGFEAVLAAGGMVYGISLSTGPYAHSYAQSQPAPFDPRRTLQEGDMARVDFYGSVDGYLFDFGRARAVGRPPDDDQAALIAAARDSVGQGLAAIRPGVPIGDIARAADASFDESEFIRRGLGLAPEFNSWGHSLGLNWEAPYIDADNDMAIVPGMCLAVEKRTATPGIGGATFEQNVLVTEGGYDLLSVAATGFGES